MATVNITRHETIKDAVEVTPDFCFAKAAEALTEYRGNGGGDNFRAAEEWRQLGLAVAHVALNAPGTEADRG